MAVRERLVHLLTEAAEIEHSLLCSYLYAALSLKRAPDGGLSPGEAKAVAGWRKTVMSVAVEEMAHLALVNNLLVAAGGAPHFDRPNLPVPPGYHPAGFIIRLAPLTKATLDHFIFLERPADAEVLEGAGKYAERAPIERVATPGHLTPSTPDYETIGEFYTEIRARLIELGQKHGHSALVDDGERQLSPHDAELPGLLVVRTIDNALAAVETIVEQGEGSSCGKANCHFSRFQAMRREWLEFEAANPSFVPHLPGAHDPVMRKPAAGIERVWITEPRAARLLDLGNAVYGLTLTCLQQVYSLSLPKEIRICMVKGAVELMHGCAHIGSALASLPAQDGGIVNGGLTFAAPRNLHVFPADRAARLMRERLSELHTAATELAMPKVAQAILAVEDHFHRRS
jgi:Ferritin-like